MAKKSKEEILADLIKEKTAAGLRPEQAKECSERQIAHDEALAAQEDEAETRAARTAKKDDGKKSDTPKS